MLAIHGGTKVRTTPGIQWPAATEEDRAAVLAAVKNAPGGDAARKAFEARFAADNDVKYCFAVSNGTVSLELLLRGYGIGVGDEVILPPYTFIATLSSLVYAGATPVFADIKNSDYLIDPVKVEKKITPRTKAIVAVAVAGCPPDIDALTDIAKKHDLRLIIDAAQAVGAAWRGKSLCTLGDAASISCQNSKNLTCGEGGIITTNDDALASALSAILYGSSDGTYHTVQQRHVLGEVPATMLACQYSRLSEQMALREKNAAYLAGRMARFPFISAADYDERITRHAYHLFLVRFNSALLEAEGITREQFMKALAAEGVPISLGYMPIYTFPCIDAAYTQHMIGGTIDTTPLPVCELASRKEGAWMYQSVLLGTRSDMDLIADAMEKVWQHRADIREL